MNLRRDIRGLPDLAVGGSGLPDLAVGGSGEEGTAARPDAFAWAWLVVPGRGSVGSSCIFESVLICLSPAVFGAYAIIESRYK